MSDIQVGDTVKVINNPSWAAGETGTVARVVPERRVMYYVVKLHGSSLRSYHPYHFRADEIEIIDDLSVLLRRKFGADHE